MKKILFFLFAAFMAAGLSACTQKIPLQGSAAQNSAGTQSAQPSIEDSGEAVIYFTVVLHVEGWEDGDNESRFAQHAEQLRAYADLFERYGGVMTLEAKEIIDGCLNWGDNVLLEMQQRGYAVGIHADAGGETGASSVSIRNTVLDMKGKLEELGITARSVSGVASKADWVQACIEADMEAVTCMVRYGLWSLDPELRPDLFEPYDTPGEGHGYYPAEAADRLSPWLTSDGASWTVHDPEGDLVIIPPGMSLNNAFEEGNSGEAAGKTELTGEDIEAWARALPVLLDAAEPGKVNTFYAVWSFGKAVDSKLLEQWLALIGGYVQSGQIQWVTIPEMIDIYRASL